MPTYGPRLSLSHSLSFSVLLLLYSCLTLTLSMSSFDSLFIPLSFFLLHTYSLSLFLCLGIFLRLFISWSLYLSIYLSHLLFLSLHISFSTSLSLSVAIRLTVPFYLCIFLCISLLNKGKVILLSAFLSIVSSLFLQSLWIVTCFVSFPSSDLIIVFFLYLLKVLFYTSLPISYFLADIFLRYEFVANENFAFFL